MHRIPMILQQDGPLYRHAETLPAGVFAFGHQCRENIAAALVFHHLEAVHRITQVIGLHHDSAGDSRRRWGVGNVFLIYRKE